MGRFYFGQILEVGFPDGHGKTAPHPMVIIDNDEACNRGEDFLCILISSSPSKDRPYYHIQVHHQTKEHPVTRFNRPCWAKCNVVREINPSRVRRTWGHMPDDLLSRIVEMYDRLLGLGDEFDDWQ